MKKILFLMSLLLWNTLGAMDQPEAGGDNNRIQHNGAGKDQQDNPKNQDGHGSGITYKSFFKTHAPKMGYAALLLVASGAIYKIYRYITVSELAINEQLLQELKNIIVQYQQDEQFELIVDDILVSMTLLSEDLKKRIAELCIQLIEKTADEQMVFAFIDTTCKKAIEQEYLRKNPEKGMLVRMVHNIKFGFMRDIALIMG